MSLDSRAARSGYTLTPSMKASVHDGRAWAAMVGAGESYLTPFGIALQATPIQLSMLVSLPPFIGALGQMFGLWLLQFLSSRRALVFWSVAVNALIWGAIALLALSAQTGDGAVALLILFATIYQVSGGIGTPAWNSLIGDLVPAETRGRYFGLRNRDIGLLTFLGMFGAGQFLGISSKLFTVAAGFAIIFLIAGLVRSISLYWLRKYDDPAHDSAPHHHFSFWAFLIKLPKSNFAKFVFFTSIINGAVAFSAPFFGLFMLEDLKLSYAWYSCITATVILVQFLTMQYWGTLLDTFGSRAILKALGFSVSIAPMLWVLDHSLWYLFLIQALNGFIWAGFNLASANFLFEIVTPAKRARCTAYQSVVNGFFVLIGSLAGGVVATNLPNQITIGAFSWQPFSPLEFLFILSGIIRFTAVWSFLPRIADAAGKPNRKTSEVLFRIVGMPQSVELSIGVLGSVVKRRVQKKPD